MIRWDNPAVKILFGVLFVISVAGIFLTILTPFIYKNLYPKTSDFIHEKVLAYRPVLVLIFVAILATATAGWQSMRYNDVSFDSGTAAAGLYAQNFYPVYKSQYKVLGVLDGTSAKIDLNHRITPVNLIGVEPFAAQDKNLNSCYARQTKSKLDELLKGKSVELESDDSLADDEKTDALVRYVIAGEKNIGQEMISLGFAKAVSKNHGYKYYDEYVEAQKTAEQKRLGLWSGTICKDLPQSKSGSSPADSKIDSGSNRQGHFSSPDSSGGKKTDNHKSGGQSSQDESKPKCFIKLLNWVCL